ncbi:hypothetical protein SAMN05428962_2756 [Paenibacillus sp. BC26]|nr:hypothetical protein SAMN05428962_2756 [Paenibacillus sp. BC26]
MENRYPWWSVTYISCFLFVVLYFLTYLIIATSYNLFSSVPADQFRELSSIYYGVLFSIIPYLPMGALMYSFVKRWTLLLVIHSTAIGFLLEKGAFVYLGTLLGTGYQWYGRNYPSSGHAVLCEELPMFCGPYISNYYIYGTIAALGASYLGIFILMVIEKFVQEELKQRVR